MEQLDTAIVSVTATILALMWTLMALRWLARIHILHNFGADDALATAALILGSGSCICVLVGESRSIFEENGISDAHMFLTPFELLYVLVTWLIKLSFCLSLQPLLRNGRFVYLLYAVGALVSIYSVFYFIWGMVNCQHLICLSEQNMIIASYAHAGVLITTDIVLVISSVYALWSLQMKTRTKISVAFFLITGASPFVATIIRTVYMSQLYNIHENPSLGTDVGIWTIMELGFCIIATAGMTLRPLAVRLKLFTSQQQSDQPTGNDSTALNAPRRSHRRARDTYPFGPLLSQDDAIRVETITTVHYQAASSLSDISPSKYAKGWSSHYEC